MRRFSLGLLGLFALSWLVPGHAAEYVVDQKDKTFSHKVLRIKVGDTVEFRNSDAFSHNVFSLSDVRTFDLGLFGQGQSRRVRFDSPGSVEVECSIHPQMHLTIEVEK